MKSLYNIKNHLKLSLGLFVLLLTFIFTSFLEQQKLKEIEQRFLSIFADRLVPATDLFFISDQLYERRLKFQAYLLEQEGGSRLPPFQLKEQTGIIDSLLLKYENTYLVENEEVCLNSFRRKWKEYKAGETEILKLASENRKQEALAKFRSAETTNFKSMIVDLHLLTKIQSQVGEDLTRSSKSSVSGSNSIFALQFGITIIIALICNGLLLANKGIKQPGQKFHLN